MLLKLIKFKLRSSKKNLILICAGLLAFAVTFAISGNIVLSIALSEFDSLMTSIASLILTPIMLASLIGFSFASVAGYIVIAYSVYQTYGKSSAYLYFTLPASRSNVYYASVADAIIKVLIISLASLVSISFAMFTFSLNLNVAPIIEEIKDGSYYILKSLLPILSGDDNTFFSFFIFIMSCIVSGAVNLIYSAVLINFSCIFGCGMAKKHKMMGAILTGIITSYAVSTIHSIVVSLPTFFFAISKTSVDISALAYGSVSTLIDAAFYAVMTIILNKMATSRLNKDFDVI